MFISKVMLTSLKEALAGSSRLRGVDNLYHQHQMLWTLFPDTPKGSMSLLFRQEYDKPLGFIVVSEKEPTKSPGWEIQTKPYSPIFNYGDVLTFKLTANPVVTRDGQRHDIVMDAIRVLKEKEKEEQAQKKQVSGVATDEKKKKIPPDRAAIARAVGLDWIRNKGQKHGFEILLSDAEFDGQKEQLNVTGYTQHRFQARDQMVGKKTGKLYDAIRLSTLDFDGVLRVTDPTLFQKIVLQGLGPAKGFGCGLMLVRRLG